MIVNEIYFVDDNGVYYDQGINYERLNNRIK